MQRKPILAVVLVFLIGIVFYSFEQPTEGPGVEIGAASDAQVSRISEGLTQGHEIRGARAIRSENHEEAWYVGAQIYGPGTNETPGVWLVMGEEDQPDTVLSVDPAAQELSDFPDGGEEDGVDASSGDPEVQALRSALR